MPQTAGQALDEALKERVSREEIAGIWRELEALHKRVDSVDAKSDRILQAIQDLVGRVDEMSRQLSQRS